MVVRTKSSPRTGTRGEPEKTRAAILASALAEFASEGLAGARTDAIAKSAGVNKALLYYYFKNKETLYGAVIDTVFANMREQLLSALETNLSPGEKMNSYIGAHFDFVASSPHYPRLVQQELMRTGRRKSPHLKRIAQEYYMPVFQKLSEVLQEGADCDEFRPVDPRRFVVCMVGAILHYFNTIPFAVAMGSTDSLTLEAISAQRSAVLDFVWHALRKA